MPSFRGSSNFRPLAGATIFGLKGLTGPTGPFGFSITGPTGSTASLIISGIQISDVTKVISYFENGTTHGASGSLQGITGNSITYFDGKTGSTGTGFIFAYSDIENKDITLRKIKGTTGFRSFVGITSSDETITITVDRFDAGLTLTAGINSQVVSTNFQSDFVGATLDTIKYGDVTNVIRTLKSNVYEKTKSPSGNTGSLTYSSSEETVIINLDPITTYNNFSDRDSLAKVFSIDLNQFGKSSIEIKIKDPLINDPIGFSLHIKNGPGITYINPSNLVFKTESGKRVLFPFDRQPCIYRKDESYLMHFISVKDNWYGYIFEKESGSGNYFCGIDYVPATEQSLQFSTFYNGQTGACCPSENAPCYTTTELMCDGYFHGIGTTCGSTFSFCSDSQGACCVKNIVDGKTNIYCLENISITDCLSLSSDSIDVIFSKEKTCEDLNCQNAFNDFGACCDGRGNCTQKTRQTCILSGNSFLGKGTSCSDKDGSQICSSGIGACCSKTGTCSITTASSCFSNNGFYHGDGTTCSGVTCLTSLNCGDFLGINLKPGDLFGGGVVVGVYNPHGSKILGAKHAFSRQGTTGTYMFGGETFSEYYASEIDFTGYGVTGETCLAYTNKENIESYYIIAALHPITVDKQGNLVDPSVESPWQETFAWYGNGVAWGPILNLDKFTLDDFTYLDKTYEKYYLQYKEGYYGVTGESLNNIVTLTLQSCAETRRYGSDPIARLFTRNIKTSNGMWNRNWGLYNTIRLVSADNADYIGLNINGGFTSGTELNAAKIIGLFDNSKYTNDFGLTGNPKELTDWYIPSHDELAFMAANCVSDSSNPYLGFNLNSHMLMNNGIPLYGWHWSSTGSFNEKVKGEGVYNSGKVQHGSVAWALFFDPNGDSSSFMNKKEQRSEQLKVRPIRAIRCDGKIPQQSTQQYKLWKVPKLLRNIK